MLKIRLTHDEIIKIIHNYETPDRVIRHCEKVASISLKLATKLNHSGYDLDLDLIHNAALLHDIAKIYIKHEQVGADYIYDLGMHDIAEIVRKHTTHVLPLNASELKEVDVVCIADRLVIEDFYAGFNARMEYILRKTLIPDEVMDIMHAHIKNTENLIMEIESILGVSFDDLFQKSNPK